MESRCLSPLILQHKAESNTFLASSPNLFSSTNNLNMLFLKSTVNKSIRNIISVSLLQRVLQMGLKRINEYGGFSWDGDTFLPSSLYGSVFWIHDWNYANTPVLGNAEYCLPSARISLFLVLTLCCFCWERCCMVWNMSSVSSIKLSWLWPGPFSWPPPGCSLHAVFPQ